MWNETGRIGGGRTDGLGNVRLALDSLHRLHAFVTARKMGFLPQRTVIGAGDTVTMILTPQATALPLLAVQSRALRCPVNDDSLAVQLWTSASRQYARDREQLYFGYVGATSRERVAAEERGYGDALSEPRVGGINPANYWPSKPGVASVQVNVPPPYAVYERHINLDGAVWLWRYSQLHFGSASHFATAEFRAGHTMTVLAQNDGVTTLGFCPRASSEMEIQGELQVGPDSTLRAARWQFIARHDDEDAGGEATFGISRLDGAPYLVAVRGSSWRRADRGHYEQERFELQDMRLGRSQADVDVRRPVPGLIRTP